MFATDTPDFLLLINNQAESEDVKHKLNFEIEFNGEWTL